MPEGEYLLRPLVSVVCTTYNHEAYIRECLDGFVLQKTNFPIEIIVHDDASTDSTVSVIKEYEEKYPHLFHIGQKIGILRVKIFGDICLHKWQKENILRYVKEMIIGLIR